MSVTFECPEAAEKEVACTYCADPDLAPGEPCHPGCPGTMQISDAPSVNLSNVNAAQVLGLMGLPEYGSCKVADFRRGLLRAQNTRKDHLVRPASFHPGGDAGVQVSREGNLVQVQRMGAAVYDQGCTEDQILERLARLERLALWTSSEGLTWISWG